MTGSSEISVQVVGAMLGVSSAVILWQGYKAAPNDKDLKRLDWLTAESAEKYVTAGLLLLASCFLLLSFGLCVPQDWT